MNSKGLIRPGESDSFYFTALSSNNRKGVFFPMELLLHVCCAPCSILSWPFLEEEHGFGVTGYFFNPNIHPYREFKKRMGALQKLCTEEGRSIIWETDYLLESFLQAVVGQGKKRCQLCYEMRLGQTAQKAKDSGFKHFSTTLLISPYQDQRLICQLGERIGQDLGIDFVALDLRHLFQQSIKISREKNIYTQGYCGCIYSEQERYAPK